MGKVYNVSMTNSSQKNPENNNPRTISYFKVLAPKRSASRIALSYLAFGVVWILTTDRLLEFFFGTSHTYNTLQTYKGWFYVAITALFVYALVVMTLELYQQARLKVQESKDELEKQYEKTLESEKRFDLAVKGSFDSIWEYDGKSARYFMSASLLKGLGYPDDEIRLESMEDYVAYIDPMDRQRFIEQVEAFSDVPSDLFELTYRVLRKDGTSAWIRTRGSAQISPTGKILKVAGSHTDISLLINHQEALTKIAFFDSLTGLPNWKGFGQNVTALIETHPGQPFTLLYLDLDDFQNINDFHGYLIGDKLLIKIARTLEGIRKEGEGLSSLGGDSFGFLLRTIDKTTILNKIAEIYAALKTIESIDGRLIEVDACIGIAQYPKHDSDFDALMHCADEAMREAKHKGKNTFVIYTNELHAQHLDQITMTNQLRKAVEKNELSMMYQPIYSLKSGKIASMEALIRWHPYGKAAVPPDLFIPFAETAGLITNIERWVFETVFKQVIAWRPLRSRNIPIAINLSSKGISDEDFVKNLVVLMDEIGILPGEIEIEITETSLIEQPEAAMKNLHLLRQQGIKILLDDFGKGYSSLTYLVSLPIDAIKIDKGFTQKIHSSQDIDAVIKGIVDLAHSIHHKVIAEGIEAENQKNFLSSLGVDYGQGYLLAYPASAAELEKDMK